VATLLYADVLLAGKMTEGNAREMKEQKRKREKGKESERENACVRVYVYRRNWFFTSREGREFDFFTGKI